MKNRLIVALDTDDGEEIDWLSATLAETVRWFKMGFQAFSALGVEAFPWFKQNGHKVFVDLKFHDIPNTVARDVGMMTKHGANMINMHAAGGLEMMQTARNSADDAAYKADIPRPILLGVTILTSIDETGFQRNFGSERQLTKQVVYLAQLAQEAGLDGVVASPLEIEPIRKACGDRFLIVTPGIRPEWAETGDQRRITTPAEAINRGADYIVVGRPILEADDPLEAAGMILDEMRGA
ncbi:orotidine-5'-phosphate decarboxylase [Candidatus Poribacteria bacterium]|nr:orotidine-5'-phosphate decarboxylase [Candidatus Poribacteria bacterium]MYB02332.1 orotidine-5'-phosphate decarboxylase [Candidatus Poribacteria bacterium]